MPAPSFPANQTVKVKTELANTQKELENVKDSEEMQGMIIGPLEEMRREMKGILLATKVGTVLKQKCAFPFEPCSPFCGPQKAMLQAGCPSKMKSDG